MSKRPPSGFTDVESFIRAHGVTVLPPAYCAPTSASAPLPSWARAIHAARETVLFPILDRRGGKHRRKRKRIAK
jgi:hypothetical protein